MFRHLYKQRIRYAETDKMGFLYYGHYAKFYEIGRVEALRSLGCSYRRMEDDLGILLPVLSLEARYKLPAYYDDEITIETCLEELPVKLFCFRHRIYNEAEKLLNTATVKLVCTSKETGKRVSTPDFLIESLASYF